MIEATSSLEHDMEERPSVRTSGSLATSLGDEKQELKNELSKFALAGVLSAVVDP